MKTLMKQLIIGTALTGFIFLSSYMGDATIVFFIGGNSTIESSSITLDGSSDKNYSASSKNDQMAGFTKYPAHPNQIITVLPISFGTADAILISN